MYRHVILASVSSLTVLTGAASVADASPNCSAFNSAAFFATATPDEVAHCLDQGAPLLPPGAPEDRPLFHAVRHATTPVVLDSLLGAAAERDELDDVLQVPGTLGRSIVHVAAAEARDPAMITWLAAWGADVRAGFDCEGVLQPKCTEPIHLAAGRTDGFLFVATLMALGANAEVPDRYGLTPTSRAADRWNTVALLGASGWASPATRLLTVQPDPMAPCDTFLTPEFFASATLAELTHCLNEGANPTATDSDGNTAVHHAAAHAIDPQLVDLLLLHLHRQDPASVTRALQRTNNTRMPPLHHAAQRGASPETIVRLLAWGGDPNLLAEPVERHLVGANRGTAPLHLAARNSGPGREAILTVLLAAGASPTQQDHRADGTGGRQALHHLMGYAPDVRETYLLGVAELARKGRIQRTLDNFLRGRASVISNDAGATALHFAASFGATLEVVRALVRLGYSPDTLDNEGISPLMHAAEKATDERVFFLLLDRSHEPCQTSSDGYSISGLLERNDVLNRDDVTGRDRTPLQAFRDRCP